MTNANETVIAMCQKFHMKTLARLIQNNDQLGKSLKTGRVQLIDIDVICHALIGYRLDM